MKEFAKAIEAGLSQTELNELQRNLDPTLVPQDDLGYKSVSDAHLDRKPEEKSDLLGDFRSPPSLISLPIPPDGGWGWVVCAASFAIMIILDGLLFR